MKNKSMDQIYSMLFPACTLHSSILRMIFRPPSMLLSHSLVTRKVAATTCIVRLSRALLPGWHVWETNYHAGQAGLGADWRATGLTCQTTQL